MVVWYWWGPGTGAHQRRTTIMLHPGCFIGGREERLLAQVAWAAARRRGALADSARTSAQAAGRCRINVRHALTPEHAAHVPSTCRAPLAGLLTAPLIPCSAVLQPPSITGEFLFVSVHSFSIFRVF